MAMAKYKVLPGYALKVRTGEYLVAGQVFEAVDLADPVLRDQSWKVELVPGESVGISVEKKVTRNRKLDTE